MGVVAAGRNVARVRAGHGLSVGSDGFHVDVTPSVTELLTRRSQESNVTLRLLAGQVVEDFLGLSYDEVLPTRSVQTACC